MSDIKSTLYAVLGKNKLGVPQYNVKEEKRGNRLTFKCELRVPGINYTGYGASGSKKDSMSNAARDFGYFLVREQKILSTDLPQLQEGELDSGHALWGAAPPVVQHQLAPHPGYGRPPPMAHHNGGGGDAYIGEMVSRDNYVRREKTEHEKYLDEKAAEVAKSEEVDMSASIHGGWTMENCKKGLNEYLQRMKLPTAVYHIKQTDSVGGYNFVAEYGLYNNGRRISGRGEGSTKKVAETSCALSVVRQLYHLKLIGPSGVSSKKKVDSLPAIDVRIDPNLALRMDKYLNDVGIHPVQNFHDAAPDAGRSLIIEQKLDAFEESEESGTYPISWSPPFINWNPWRGNNIDEAPLAYMNLEQISQKLLDEEEGMTVSDQMRNVREKLPVYQIRTRILEQVANNPVVLIKGATGCGKSTQVCQYLMEEFIRSGKGANFNCFVSQPRRISAITLAERVAAERGDRLGNSVGYAVRFDSMSPRPFGAVMFVTVGVLLRKLEMGMRGVSHVIIDEIHERDINTDFLLIIVRELIRNNNGLRVILMSATIDTSKFSDYFNTNSIVEMPEHANEVQAFFLEDTITFLDYLPQDKPEKKKKKKKPVSKNDADEDIATCDEGVSTYLDIDQRHQPRVREVLGKMNEAEIPLDLIECLLSDIQDKGAEGAILVFLPGWNIISMMLSKLEDHPIFGDRRQCVVLPLHSQLTSREQHLVFDHPPPGVRKIILATNIAETSITIDDVVFVIDSCRAREKLYSSRNNMTHFATVWASKNSLIQRRGRAGRVAKGFCFHLCTRKRFEMLDEHPTPEMLRTPLHETALMIKLLRLGPIYDFLEKAIQTPPLDNIVEAELVLKEISAFDTNNELTPLGKILARLPIGPIMGKILILGASLGLGNMMCSIAAATSFNSPYVQKERFHSKLSHAHRRYAGNYLSDHIGLLAANQCYRDQAEISDNLARTYCNQNLLNPTTLAMSNDARRQLRDVLVNSGFPEECFYEKHFDANERDPDLTLFLSLITSAVYPNVGYIREKRNIYTLERASALLNKMSVCVPFDSARPIEFDSPILMFTEKLRTNCITCHQISAITPLQLLLFGSKRVEAISECEVVLDDMIPLRMPAQIAAYIVALRPCIEAMIVRACRTPESLRERSPQDIELISLLKELSLDTAWGKEVTRVEMGPPRQIPRRDYDTTRFNHSGPIRDYTVNRARPSNPYSRNGPGNGYRDQRPPAGGNGYGLNGGGYNDGGDRYGGGPMQGDRYGGGPMPGNQYAGGPRHDDRFGGGPMGGDRYGGDARMYNAGNGQERQNSEPTPFNCGPVVYSSDESEVVKASPYPSQPQSHQDSAVGGAHQYPPEQFNPLSREPAEHYPPPGYQMDTFVETERQYRAEPQVNFADYRSEQSSFTITPGMVHHKQERVETFTEDIPVERPPTHIPSELPLQRDPI